MNGFDPILYSRRDFGRLALAALPLTLAVTRINSKVRGVQLGVITYSFRSMSSLDDMIAAIALIGLGEVELMYDHAERAAGAPGTDRGGSQSDLRAWRLSGSMGPFKEIRRKFSDAGLQIQLLCFNMNEQITDDEIEYAFQMAKALGARAISTSTRLPVARRIAPFANKHRMRVGFHGHSDVKDPNELATPESFATAMSYSKYHGVNLDIGHFTAANFDALSYIQQNFGRITNLHLKDRRRNQGDNVPWGQGDTPIKEVLQLLAKRRYGFPANIEYEYDGQDPVTEVRRCFEFCKRALA